MTHTDYEALFQRVYANLPLNARNEIVAVVDDAPLTWNAARVEIDNHTEKGKQILEQLIKLKLLHEQRDATTEQR